jgi:hypothetical protein
VEYILIVGIIVVLIIQGVSLSNIRQKLDELQWREPVKKPEKPAYTPPVSESKPQVFDNTPSEAENTAEEKSAPPVTESQPQVSDSQPQVSDSQPQISEQKPYVMPPAEPLKPRYMPPPGTVSKPRSEYTYKKSEPTEKNYENFIGGRLFPVIAAILIFIGLIFLCVTAFTRFGAAGKIAIIFGASAVVTAAGVILALRAKNAFSEAVLGCGLGSFLISLMAAHFYFEYVGVAALLILLIVWGAAVFALSKKFDSFALTLVSHIGLTICFIICAFSHIGQDIVYRWGFILFECAASALIIICGLMSNKKATVSGLCGSAIMLLMTTIALSVNADIPYGASETAFWSPDDITTVVRLIIQIVLVLLVSGAACFISERQFTGESHFAAMQSVFGVVYTATFFTALGVSFDFFFRLSTEWVTFGVINIAVLVAAAVAALVMLRMRKAEGKYTAAAWFSLCVLFIMLIVHINSYPRFSAFDFSLFLPFAFGFLLLYKFNRFKPLLIFAAVAAGFDWIYMIAGGFAELSSAASIPFAFSLLFVLAYMAFGLCFYRSVPATKRGESTLTPVRIISFIAAQICLVEILSEEIKTNEDIIAAIIFCIIGTLVWCAYANLQNQSKAQSIFLLANEAVILVASLTVATGADNPGGAYLLLIFAAIYAAFRMHLLFRNEMGKAETIYSAVKWLFVIHAAAAVFGLSSEYVFSIIIIAYGLLCVVGGFALTNKTLRTAGLVISLFAVVKMTIVDVWEAENIVRVAALITGGVICFAISAIYNKAAKKLSAEKTIENTEENIETE